jgi:hypothetical protein
MRTCALFLLALGACAPEAASLPTDQAAVPGNLSISASEFVLGNSATITVTGAAPNANVFLGYSFNQGNGPCPPQLGGECLGLAAPQLLGTFRANGSGQVSLPVNLPPQFPTDTIYLQAAVLTGTADLSPVYTGEFFAGNGDEDGDDLSNSEEIDAATDLFVPDSDGGGAEDGEEVSTGTDALDPDDDVLYELDSFTGSVQLTLDFQGLLAGAACTFAGVCDCNATLSSDGVRIDQDGYRVLFDGTWTVTANTCSAAVPIGDFLWLPSNGQAYHSLTFGAGAASLDSWVAHADIDNFAPISPDDAALAAEQAPLVLGVPWDGVTPTLSFSSTTTTSEMGVDVVATATSTVTFNP